MSVYLPAGCTSYRYDFWFKKQRYLGSTEQTTKKAAEEFERLLRERLKRDAAKAALERASGIPKPLAAPRFTDWAAVYRTHVAKLVEQGRMTRADRVEFLLRVILRFFGARPSGRDGKNPPVEGEPYHNLRLDDPLKRPQWIEDFELWMTRRGIAGQTKNQYRSTVRQMYQLAMQPKWRQITGVTVNPMDGIYRDRPGIREVILTPEQLRAILSHASYHLRLAVAIGALAPKLRLANILALEWDRHVDATLQFITVHEHKTVTKTRRPLVIPISQQLREILKDARQRAPASKYVITYQRKQIDSLRGALKNAVTDAGLPYGRFVDDGVTFHTLRHTAATLLAEQPGLSEKLRSETMGQDMMTTQKYTHLRPVAQRPIVEALSAVLPVLDLVTSKQNRAVRLTGTRRSAGLQRKSSAGSEQERTDAGTFTMPTKAK